MASPLLTEALLTPLSFRVSDHVLFYSKRGEGWQTLTRILWPDQHGGPSLVGGQEWEVGGLSSDFGGLSSADGSFSSLFPLVVKGPWSVPAAGERLLPAQGFGVMDVLWNWT